jgi:hypothetical protein
VPISRGIGIRALLEITTCGGPDGGPWVSGSEPAGTRRTTGLLRRSCFPGRGVADGDVVLPSAAVLRVAGRLGADFWAADGRAAGRAERFVAADLPAVDLLAVDFFAVDFFAVGFPAGDFLAAVFLAVDFFAVAFFAVDLLAADFFAVDFFAVDFFAAAFFAVDFFAVDFFAAAFFAVDFFAAPFLAADFLALPFFAVAFFAADFFVAARPVVASAPTSRIACVLSASSRASWSRKPSSACSNTRARASLRAFGFDLPAPDPERLLLIV